MTLFRDQQTSNARMNTHFILATTDALFQDVQQQQMMRGGETDQVACMTLSRYSRGCFTPRHWPVRCSVHLARSKYIPQYIFTRCSFLGVAGLCHCTTQPLRRSLEFGVWRLPERNWYKDHQLLLRFRGIATNSRRCGQRFDQCQTLRPNC